ncbi:XcyI family restriction endonuclease [Sporomusa sp.]|uniref:XcyI family restriction endonuclease n=1 Tax=Sporomusa sp. TaxID=2078658 RepID=UPI002C652892|nr:XcyI family restriction endonuclease [Sporomusa sp.]HWR42279.1 XcyI family restriction endonuclease [Sporomusa sp.]
MPKVPKEVIYESYVLKSTFFYNKLNSLGFFDLFQDIKKISEDNSSAFGWEQRGEWGISEEAWEKVNAYGLDPILVFAHPNIVRIQPQFIRYYRSIILMPQKGFQYISGISGIQKLEEPLEEQPTKKNKKERKALGEEKVNALIKTINEVMSILVSLSTKLDEESLKGMMFATAGTTIDGSWRNAIGVEGERIIKTLILKTLLDNNEVLSIIDNKGKSKTIEELRAENIDPLERLGQNTTRNKKSEKSMSIVVKNGAIIIFSSEPDVELLNKEGSVLGAVEIKAGLDPAGALERLGAMFKSFEETLSEHPNALTILVASCITDEVESRIKVANSVRQTWILTDIINNKKNSGIKFGNMIRSIVGLIPRRM